MKMVLNAFDLEGFVCKFANMWKDYMPGENFLHESHFNISAFIALQNITLCAKHASAVMALLLMICRTFYYQAR